MSDRPEDETKLASASEPASEGAGPVSEGSAKVPAPSEESDDDEAIRRLVKGAFAKSASEIAASGDAESAPGDASGSAEPDASAEASGDAESEGELEAAPDSRDDEAIRSLLKKSFVEPQNVKVPDLVTGVQRKLRKRSRGKFYADGWSTTSSKANYALVAVAMLLIVALAYLVLGPTGISIR